MNPRDRIVGCILAGGRSSRMGGGDKALLPIGGEPMLGRVRDRLALQVRRILLNANGDPGRLAEFNLPVVADTITGFAGPLAGVAAGMSWIAEQEPEASHIVTVAADTPFFPTNLVDRLATATALAHGSIGMATTDGNRHPVFALWPVALLKDLEDWMSTTDTFKVVAWARRHDLRMVEFPMIELEGETVDPFFNVNTPQDLVTAEAVHARLAATLVGPA